MDKAGRIAEDYKSGKFSIDALVGKHLSKAFTKDKILAVIRDTRWSHYKETSVKL